MQILIVTVLCLVVFVSACSTQEISSTLVTPTTAADPVLVPGPSVSVLTNRYNSARTGANLQEAILNHTNVNPQQFGKLFTREVEGHIYAQPLYVPNIEIPGRGIHNVVYVATMSNNVYAFDADDPALNEPLWQTNLGTPFTQLVYFDIPGGEVGILGTPVIDLETQTLFAVSRNWEEGEERAVYKLHVLDITTGEVKSGGPREINLTYSGSGIGNIDGLLTLDAYYQLQRTGMLLMNGHLYFGFGSANDRDNWHGWLVTYEAANIDNLLDIHNATPDGEHGGIWMAGSGISSDDTYIYLATANGTYNAHTGGNDHAQSILKMQLINDEFTLIDYYTPTEQSELNRLDSGLGSTGVVIIPETDLLVAGGKDGNLYVVNRNQMGRFDPETDQNVQIFRGGDGRIYATPVFWGNGPNNLPTLYSWNEFDTFKAYNLDVEAQQFDPEPVSESQLKGVGMPVGALALSASGADPATGILWVTFAPSADADNIEGVLVALDATDLNVILWHSEMERDRDDLGLLAKFNPVTVVNGKVYVPTFSNALHVYGLLANETD